MTTCLSRTWARSPVARVFLAWSLGGRYLLIGSRDGELLCTNFTAALPSTPFLSPITDPEAPSAVLQVVAL